MADEYEAALDALKDREVTALDLDIFRVSVLLDDAIFDGVEGVAEAVAELARNGWDQRLLTFALNVVMREWESGPSADVTDAVAFVADFNGRLDRMVAEARSRVEGSR